MTAIQLIMRLRQGKPLSCRVVEQIVERLAAGEWAQQSLADALGKYANGFSVNDAWETVQLEIETLQKKLAESQAQVRIAQQRIEMIQRVCGYIEDGSNTVIRIGQDEATKAWVLSNDSVPYTMIAWADTFFGMLDAAFEEAKRLRKEG